MDRPAFKRNGCETVTVNESIYADDTICAFVNRKDLVLNVPILYETFEGGAGTSPYPE